MPGRPLLLALALLVSAPLRAQDSSATLRVMGDVATPLVLTASDLGVMPRARLSASSNGITTTYEGVWLSDVLTRAGVPQGETLRGAALSGYLVARASDGYEIVFSLGEVDPALTGGQFLLADRADGAPLVGEQGTFRLLVPGDTRGARSIRMLVAIEVVQRRKGP